MSNDTNELCGRADLLRDYAFDELAPAERSAVEQHLTACDDCSLELDRLRLTVAALRVIPDSEMPRRIAFVADTPRTSTTRRWVASFWSSGARLGFASACVLSLAIVTAAWHRPVVVTPAAAGVSKQEVDQTVARAVAGVRSEIRAEVKAEDARVLATALETADRKHEQEHRALLVAMDENMTVLEKRLNTLNSYAMLSSADARPAGGQ